MNHHAARRFALREQTTSAHASLDARVGALDEPAVYARYLRGVHAFRTTAEAHLAASGAAWQPEPLAPLIAEDMADLGIAPQDSVALALPSDGSGLIGLGYVLAGSSLGARLLVRQAEALGYGAGHGARHLASQTDLTGWRAFLELLEATEPFDSEAAAAGAEAGFVAAERAFDGA